MVRTPMVADIPPDLMAAFEQTQPVGRLGEPEEVAEAAVWLCSDRASFVSGVPLPVDAASSAD
jgi:NAD(P)-dependent dehydrogenase (short-subunit alcohol dehydrogenase family)